MLELFRRINAPILAAAFSLLVLIISTGLLAVFGQPIQMALLSGSVAGAISFGAGYFVLHKFVFLRIAQINDEIDQIIKRKLNGNTEHGRSELISLERGVKRLIKEKTNEIDSLRQLEQYRKEFLGNVAHELRSPIFNVQGYVYTLLEGAVTDEEVNVRFLKKAATNIDHLSSLVEDLVTINMIESGELHIDLQNFNLKELVREVIELLDLPAKNRNIHLQLKSNTENGIYVYADRQRIRQVLVNLITNSIKYGKDYGHTTISLQDMHHLIAIEVSDNGEGIAEEHLTRIFERFYRIDKSRARTHTSTGLGLSIVKHFIEAHKQKILVSSIEEVGSIFSFTLEKAKTNL